MFGFDPTTMTDDELMKKQQLISSRLAAASQLGTSSVIDQMMTMMTMIGDEQRERQFTKRWNANASVANMPIETDPDVRDQQAAAHAEKAAKGAQVTRRNTVAVRRVTPSKTPVRPEIDEASNTPEAEKPHGD